MIIDTLMKLLLPQIKLYNCTIFNKTINLRGGKPNQVEINTATVILYTWPTVSPRNNVFP